MDYRTVAKCGLEASLVGLGCNNFGGRSSVEESRAVIHKALDLGITFIDTADVYPNTNRGRSEEILGDALGPRRKDVVLATKFGIPMGPDLKAGLSRRYIVRAVEASLKRLKTDWIDLYQAHRTDPATPIEETLRALEDLISQGKIRYAGICNVEAWQVVEADWTARSCGLDPFVSAQNEYSLLYREPDRDLMRVTEKYGLGFLPFFPLAAGLLTGKYRADAPVPEGSRYAKTTIFVDRYMTPENWEIVQALEAFAAARGHSLLELAFSWLASRPSVWSIIAGASTPAQLETNVKAVDWKLTADDLAEIDRLTDVPPPLRVG